MVPNPIYTGNPMAIYDEIVDLKFRKKGIANSGTQSKDQEYVEIHANPANDLQVGAFLPIDKHKFAKDNDTFQVSQ